MWPFGKGIVDQIKDVLGQNKVSRDLPVQVEERNGEVVLKGDVPTEDHKSLLETFRNARANGADLDPKTGVRMPRRE